MNEENKEEMTKEDVWGKFDDQTREKLSSGMVLHNSKEKCSIFKDEVPFKSVTIVCNEDDIGEVSYWLDYVQGGDCISMYKDLPNGKVAIRADYQCW